ncbi:MAG: CocE/NonD family hydrolase, partial [Bacteroidota bacterium]
LGTDHFTALNYGNSVAAAYPNFPGRGDMDASFAPVDAAGEGDASGTNNRYTNMEVPAYHLTGWWDIFVDGQITTWENMREHTSVGGPAKETQKIIIGPWAHQTIGSATTGDVTYNSNVKDIIGIDFDTVDFNNVDVPSFLNSELITWLRYTLNQNGYKNIGEPKYLIPQSNNYQPVSGPFGLTAYARVPAEDFTFTLEELLNYLSGEGSLGDVAYSVHASPGGTVVFSGTYPIEPLNPPLITSTGGAAGAIQVPDFANDVPDFRGYVVGPVGDGVPANANVGNYWLSGDEFPLTSNIACTEMFLHQDGSLDGSIPTADEGSLGYMHDPENPARTIGGANMIPSVPGPSGRTSQGQIDLADPALRPYGLDHPGVIAFETAVLTDTVSIVGFPEARLFASSAPRGVAAGAPTSTDFMVTIVDVYPDGRELFVVEGAVNARARDYARTLLADNEDINAPFTNINSGDVYEYNFRLLPIAYTFGKDHKIKVLISSASYPRYQSNPNLPLEAGEFFRWEPGGTNTYNFQGANMSPRIADNTLHFSDTQPSSIILPVFTEQVNAQVKVFLQGALGGTFMGTALNGAGIVPNIQPYNVAPYNYAGSENLSIIPPNVVDWVLLELREDTPDMDVVARKAALLRNDGTVVDVKGSTNISFDHVPAGQYHLSVRHRNHLGIMTKASLSFN